MNEKLARVLNRVSRRQRRAFLRLPHRDKGLLRKTFTDYCIAAQRNADETGRMEWCKPTLVRTCELAGYDPHFLRS